MNQKIKLGLYIVFAIGMIWFAALAIGQYRTIQASEPSPVAGVSDVTEVHVPLDDEATNERSNARGSMIKYGLGCVVCAVLLAIVVGIDVSSYLGDRALDFVFNDDLKGVFDEQYDMAEQEWAKGNYLEAINILREYLNRKPNQIHAQLRIAEIYENDMMNFLASALEYEDLLTKPVPRKRWGWAAIHLCNLYTGRLDQVGKAIALLQKIAVEYHDTPAAEKARTRLEQLGYDVPAPASAHTANPQDASLPPGFGPKKG